MDLLAAMRVFVAIVDAGSMTRAAERLDRSQPSVVRTLAALEAHVGVTLLRRTTRRMSLTPEGREFIARSRRILSDVEDAERAIGQDEDEPRGDIRMTAPVEFGRMHLTPAVTAFLWRYEQVRVDLLLADRNSDLVEESVDLALRIGPLSDSSMIAIRVGEVQHVTVASPALLEHTGTPEHPSELSALPCIRQRVTPGDETTWVFGDDGKDIAVAVDGRFGCTQIAAAVSACVNGMGFGRFLSYQVQALVSEGKLRYVLDDFAPSPRPVSLVYPGSRLVPSRVRVLIAWLRETLPARGAFLRTSDS
jgi:DNA-binding transcriptional LysR family regulator